MAQSHDGGWAEEQVKALEELYMAKNMSAGRIAQQPDFYKAGITRNAIIGKIHRLGWPKRGQDSSTGSKRVTALRHRERTVVIRPEPAFRPPPAQAAPAPKPQVSARPQAAIESNPVTIAELQNGSCRWPLGEPYDLETFRYCGARRFSCHGAEDGVFVGPYCLGHMQMATASPLSTGKKRPPLGSRLRLDHVRM